MTWRPALGIVLTVLLLAACFLVGRENAELLARRIEIFAAPSGRLYGLTVGQALLGCLALGAAVTAIAWTVRSTRSAAQRAEERRGLRRRESLAGRLVAGLQASAAGRPEEAFEELEAVLEQDPGHEGALAAAADALRGMDRPAEAVEMRQRLLARRADDPAVLTALAEDHHARGDVELAARDLEKALAKKPADEAGVARRLLELRLEQGDFAAALSAHDRWAKLQTSAPAEELALQRAALETRQAARGSREGRLREGLAALKKIVRRHPDYAPASLALAQAHLLAGEEPAAVEVWIEGYERTREGAFLVAAEDHYLGERSDDEDAIERTASALAAMKRFAQCSGERPQAVAFLGKLQTRFEMIEDAAVSFDSVRESFPENPTFTYYAARIAEKRGRHDVAAEWYRGILKALDILRPSYRCRSCETEAPEWRDRCGSCGRWGSVSLDIGIKPLLAPLPAAHPVYEVADEPSEGEPGTPIEEQQGA